MYIYHDISHLDSLKTLYNAGLRDPLIALCMLSVIKSRSERIFFESLSERWESAEQSTRTPKHVTQGTMCWTDDKCKGTAGTFNIIL